MRLKADDDDVTIFSFALQIFFCQHITLGHFDNTEPGKVYDRNGYFKGPQPFTSLMADLLLDNISILSQMKRVTKYKSSLMT